jgi:hypothetical protein
LRLDVSGASLGAPYAIPASNPFVGNASVRDEVWAIGVRNPWRFSFDSETGDLYIADVGQNRWEEVNFEPSGDPGGRNYGWRLKEGTHCYSPSSNCDPGGLTEPIHEYEHAGFPRGCSITGGYVYRGEDLPLYQGMYFFGDYCTNEVWGLVTDSISTLVADFSDQLQPGGGITSFGQDVNGEVYIVAGTQVARIVPVMQFEVPTLVAGNQVTVEVTGAPANTRVYFGYSLTGTGSFALPGLGVDVALDGPSQVGSVLSGATGSASYTFPLPAGSTGTEVWMQAVTDGNTSNVHRTTIQ